MPSASPSCEAPTPTRGSSLSTIARRDLFRVVAVATGEDALRLTEPMPQGLPFSGAQAGRTVFGRCLAAGKANYVGDPVVAVVAETEHAAREGARRVRSRTRSSSRCSP